MVFRRSARENPLCILGNIYSGLLTAGSGLSKKIFRARPHAREEQPKNLYNKSQKLSFVE
jgi:hypothetical protein